ncbi:hypothetical protein FRC19_000790 [Serendipita sp. 401]|nr:hypothetical protein FRC19_000790 [Serendipita sp. 401]
MDLQQSYAISTALIFIVLSLVFFRRRISTLLTLSEHRPEESPYGSTAQAPSFSLQRAFASFQAYPNVVASEVTSYYSKFNSLRGGHRRVALELDYPSKIEALRKCNAVNSDLTRGICEMARKEFPELTSMNTKSLPIDIAWVRESLKHLVRDWSVEGARERRIIFEPILAQLENIPESERASCRVLVPGAGLGRLAWEVCTRGFDTTSCELSFYMNLSLRFLLSPSHTTTTFQHRVSPYSHWWSHQRSNANTFREIEIPDVLPRRQPNWTILETDFLGLSPPSSPFSDQQPFVGYDFIVTLYFIDTASNIITYLKHIHYLLKPGGKWINLGPLLYSNAVLELSLEEVLRLADMTGFDVESSSRLTVPSEYTADREAMMKWVYQAEFWVATRRPDQFIL